MADADTDPAQLPPPDPSLRAEDPPRRPAHGPVLIRPVGDPDAPWQPAPHADLRGRYHP